MDLDPIGTGFDGPTRRKSEVRYRLAHLLGGQRTRLGMGCMPFAVNNGAPGGDGGRRYALTMLGRIVGTLIRPTCMSWMKMCPPLACTALDTACQPATWASV